MVYGRKASKQASIHMHVCNAVTLVWGSFRLSPMTYYYNNNCLCFIPTYMHKLSQLMYNRYILSAH